jgi:hypothetical protein
LKVLYRPSDVADFLVPTTRVEHAAAAGWVEGDR